MTSPARSSRTRSTACSPWPPRTRGSTCPASPSAGWSFGGYLAALAVLRRPDVIHAAIAGAPVTDWRLYDTFYTERYLGDPDADAAAYDACSVLPDADKLERPLLLIHGLADDNVVSAHTLQLSSALLAAGRPHQVLPLTGVTHMANQEDVAENLLLFQLAFLRQALPGGADATMPRRWEGHLAWARKDLNLRRQCRLVYSQFPLATRARTQGLRR